MSVNYTAIQDAIRNILLTNDTSRIIDGDALSVGIESVLNPATIMCPWAGIYLDSWDTPAEQERIGGATPFLTQVTFELWLYAFALETDVARIKRDALLSAVKDVLKLTANRTLGGTVLITRFKGGSFSNAKGNQEGFYSGVSLKLECEVRE